MEDLYRIFDENFDKQVHMMRSHFDRQDKMLDELTRMMRATNQRLADLQHLGQQPRLATEADVEPDAKTHTHTEGAAADRVKHGDSSSSARVDHDPMRLASFDDDSTEPLAFSMIYRDEAPVDEGAEAPKPCLSPGEMNTTTTAGGSPATGTAPEMMRAIYFPTDSFLKP